MFIEEPENGLYHHYLADLAEEMKKNVGRGYALSPEEVWVLRKEADGFSVAQRVSDYPFVNELTEQGVVVGDLWYDKYFG